MIYPKHILCITCEKCYELGIQMGVYPATFQFECKDCKTTISGEVKFEPFELILKNATELNEEAPNYQKYTKLPIWRLDVSSEFPTNKLYLKETVIDGILSSPFLNQAMRLDKLKSDSEYGGVTEISKAMKFADFVTEGKFNNILRLFNLFWNKQEKYLYRDLKKLLDENKHLTPFREVKNVTDATMVLHQMFLTTSGISNILGNGTLAEYTSLAKKIYFSEEHRDEIIRYIDHIESDFDTIERKAFEILETFSSIYSIMIPVVTLLNSNGYNRLDQASSGVSAANYKKLNDFYASSYEWILDNINLVIALNNIFERNSYDNCCNGRSYHNNLESIPSKFNKVNQYDPGQAYLDVSEPFSKPVNNLNNKIRNAIQHFSSQVDYDNQKIIFEDRHQGRVRQEEYSIVDFIKICLANFSLIIYILEIIYTFRKLKFINDGITPSIYWIKNEEISKVMSDDKVKDNFQRKLKNRINKKRRK